MQNTRHVAMVRPASFGFNEETAADNFFQDPAQKESTILQEAALAEFDAMVALLQENGINVLVLQDNPLPPKPDAVFLNNWFCCNNGMIQVFPMHSRNRRLEKSWDIIDAIRLQTGISVVKDWGSYEEKEMFLESTGSIVFDHNNRLAYACISARTNENLFRQFCKENNYTPLPFNAADPTGRPVYHTNVLMCIGKKFAVICLDAIPGTTDRLKVVHELETTGHEIIDISFEQVNRFAGNMLELVNDKDDPLLVMSKTAYDSLLSSQIKTLRSYATIISPDISMIEKAGGGSVRCMMAELFY